MKRLEEQIRDVQKVEIKEEIDEELEFTVIPTGLPVKEQGHDGYIPLDDDQKIRQKGIRNRLIREDENDDSDEDTEKFYSSRADALEEDTKRREQQTRFLEQEEAERKDSDEEMERWEQQQILKAVGAATIGQVKHEYELTTQFFQRSTIAENKESLRKLEFGDGDKQSTAKELSEKYKMYQDMKLYVRSLLDFVFVDALDEYSNISKVLDRIIDWLVVDGKSFQDAYVHLCIPKLLSPYIRLQLCQAEILKDPNFRLDDQAWYTDILTAGASSEIDPQHPVVVGLLPAIVEKVVVPYLTELVADEWDPLSFQQTQNLTTCLNTIIREYPTITSKSKMVNRLANAIQKRAKDSVSEDIFIPIDPSVIIKVKALIAETRNEWMPYMNVQNMRSLLGEEDEPNIYAEEARLQMEKTMNKNSELKIKAEEARLMAEESVRLEADVQDLNEIFTQLQTIVHQQHDMVDSIEEHVEQARSQVERGNQQLKQAVKHKNAKKLEREMLDQLEQQEESVAELDTTFSSLRQEVEAKARKLKKISIKLQKARRELQDLHIAHSDERRELERDVSQMNMELKLK
ncbi:unnamed protein product, partial [Mesorhabditis spiculigera]